MAYFAGNCEYPIEIQCQVVLLPYLWRYQGFRVDKRHKRQIQVDVIHVYTPKTTSLLPPSKCISEVLTPVIFAIGLGLLIEWSLGMISKQPGWWQKWLSWTFQGSIMFCTLHCIMQSTKGRIIFVMIRIADYTLRVAVHVFARHTGSWRSERFSKINSSNSTGTDRRLGIWRALC